MNFLWVVASDRLNNLSRPPKNTEKCDEEKRSNNDSIIMPVTWFTIR